MLELAEQLLARLDAGERLAVSIVTEIGGSAPRTLGTAMAVTTDGTVVGSISSGCVEGAAVEVSELVLETGQPVLTQFGFSDDDAFAIGLSCGGTIEVSVLELGPDADARVLETLRDAAAGRASALALIVAGPGAGGILAATSPMPAGVDESAGARIRAELTARRASGVTGSFTVDCAGVDLRVLTLAAAPPPRLYVYGAVDFAAALTDAAALLGYRVTVCDARATFATSARFPTAAEVVVAWPHEHLTGAEIDERTVICVLTHDDKFDVPLLRLALGLDVGYVGAMGSRRSHERRLDALRAAGVPADALARLHSPIGLDLGASTPQETALSILAEVLAGRTGGTGIPLSKLDGPIHARAAAEARGLASAG